MSDKIETRRWKPGDLMTRTQAAEYLGVCTSRLAQLRRQGEIEHRKNEHTGRVHYRFVDVDELATRRASAPSAEDDAPDTEDAS